MTELTTEQKSLALDVLALAKAYVRNDKAGFELLLGMFRDNGEYESVIAALLGHYLVAVTALGKRDGFTPDQIVDKAHRAIVRSQSDAA